MDIRAALLKIIQERNPSGSAGVSLQINSILNMDRICELTNCQRSADLEMEILTQWHELFRIGYLAWGVNLSNPSAPFFHITKKAKQAFQQINRDPSNPYGYLAHLYASANLNSIAKSYIEEGLQCFVSGNYKASAVMVGGAAEAVILDLKEQVLCKLQDKGQAVNSNLGSWQIKSVLKGLKGYFDNETFRFQLDLKEEYDAYWPAFTQQIRAVRNEVGHPNSVEPITADVVHASFLIFPELAKLAKKLGEVL